MGICILSARMRYRVFAACGNEFRGHIAGTPCLAAMCVAGAVILKMVSVRIKKCHCTIVDVYANVHRVEVSEYIPGPMDSRDNIADILGIFNFII